MAIAEAEKAILDNAENTRAELEKAEIAKVNLIVLSAGSFLIQGSKSIKKRIGLKSPSVISVDTNPIARRWRST